MSRRRSAAGGLVLVWMVASQIASTTARGDDTTPPPTAAPTPEQIEEARVHYTRGLQLYGQSSFGPALVELQRAYKTAPSYRILYSIALVQIRVGDLAGASVSFQQYLDDGGAEVTDARKTEVTTQMAELAGKIAAITVRVMVDGADVLVDDIPIGKTPLPKPLFLNPGFHKLAVSKSGFDGEAKRIGVAAGDKTQIDLQLTPSAPVVVPIAVPVPPPQPAPLPAPPPRPRTDSAAPSSPPTPRPLWIGWTVTGALAAGAGVVGIAALDASAKLRDDMNKPTPKSDIDSAHRTTTNLALASDILSGAAIVAGGMTLYFALTPKRSASTAWLRVGPGTVGIDGRF